MLKKLVEIPTGFLVLTREVAELRAEKKTLKQELAEVKDYLVELTTQFEMLKASQCADQGEAYASSRELRS